MVSAADVGEGEYWWGREVEDAGGRRSARSSIGSDEQAPDFARLTGLAAVGSAGTAGMLSAAAATLPGTAPPRSLSMSSSPNHHHSQLAAHGRCVSEPASPMPDAVVLGRDVSGDGVPGNGEGAVGRSSRTDAERQERKGEGKGRRDEREEKRRRRSDRDERRGEGHGRPMSLVVAGGEEGVEMVAEQTRIVAHPALLSCTHLLNTRVIVCSHTHTQHNTTNTTQHNTTHTQSISAERITSFRLLCARTTVRRRGLLPERSACVRRLRCFR
jgi:hypothetical protein